jgi:probable lipoprotein NlpC
MARYSLILIAIFSLYACGTSNYSYNKPKYTRPTTAQPKIVSGNTSSTSFSNNVVSSAKRYLGTPYVYAGNTPQGFDCSGFIGYVYKENGFVLPRRSADIALMGDKISNQNIQKGDMLFFATSGGSQVSHIGIVSVVQNSGEINFIHASSSKGVMVSSLNEPYWSNAYLFAKRL